MPNAFYKFVHPQLFDIKHKFVHLQLVWHQIFVLWKSYIFREQKSELEDKVFTFFKNIDSELSPCDIEACHRLEKDNDRVIVKFPRRKNCEQIMSVKKDLKHLKMQEVGLPGNCLIFINTSLWPTAWCDRNVRLHDLGIMSNFYIFSGTIKAIIPENKNPISITHTQDLVKYFPEVDLLPTSLLYKIWSYIDFMQLLSSFSLLVCPRGPG